MKAWYLVKNGKPQEAFELRETEAPVPGPEQVLIRVEASGLNFADVMARLGYYEDAPAIPCVLGYDVAGVVKACGSNADPGLKGKRVAALTRFGGYAEYALTDHRALAVLPDNISFSEGTALGTQYLTAWYSMFMHMRLIPGDVILVHAAAGGVGTALTQMARHIGCQVIGLVGSDEKIPYVRENGVDYPVNYRKTDYEQEALRILGNKRLRASFNPVAGKSFKKDIRLLGAGGTLLLFGASSRVGRLGKGLASLKMIWDMGILLPILLVAKSKSIAGVNMLRIADHQPQLIEYAMGKLVRLLERNLIRPHIGAVFPAEDLPAAHALLESRKSMGKICIIWS